MNVDEAMEEARQFGEQESKDMLFAEHIAILLAEEVERLRAEVERLDVARLLGTALEVERLRAELADTENARDSWRRVCEKETEAKHQAWAELAAAKAASACPVKVVYCDPDYERTATVVLWSNADAQRFADWLNERMKDKTPPQA